MTVEHLSWALEDFSGYVAADELYDGPFCVLSIVDNRTFKRICVQVLEHAPTNADIAAFLRTFRTSLDARGLQLRGLATDGSTLYPQPIAEVFGDVPHQVCMFHSLHEVARSIQAAVAQERKKLAAAKPPLGRGPARTRSKRRILRTRRRLQRKIRDLFVHRHLFVRRELTAEQQTQFESLVRGRPRLRRLRYLMDDVYGLYDCGSHATALAEMSRLQARVQRRANLDGVLKFTSAFKKSLTFLDHPEMPRTTNAVERSNRRYRKMQKSVYRVRVRRQVVGRIAMDLERESAFGWREQECRSLYLARAA